MFWKTVFIHPLANALVFFTALFGGNVGWGIIALTLLVKIILAPLTHKATLTQIEQAKLQPLIKDLQKQYPDKKEQAQKMMELYREHKTNPFAGLVVILIQFPIIIALYRVIIAGVGHYGDALYSFVTMPAAIHTLFLGIDLATKSIILAVVAGIVQFIQIKFSPAMQKSITAPVTPAVPGEKSPADFAASMQTSMKYTLPIMMVVIGITLPAAVTLYLIATSVFTIIQDQITRVILKRKGKI